MTNDDLDERDFKTLETCGKALGFALKAAFNQGDLHTTAGTDAFTDSLNQLMEDERFSPDVTLVLTGLIQGIRAYPRRSTPDNGNEFI